MIQRRWPGEAMMLRSCLMAAGLLLAGCSQREYRDAGSPAASPPIVPSEQADERPAWTVDCKLDRFDGKEKCAVSLRLAFRSGIVGFLLSPDNGRSWSLVSAPQAVSGRLKIDDHRAIAFTCAPGPSCPLPQAGRLFAQLRAGEKLAIEYAAGTEGQVADRDFFMSGFADALAKAGGPPPRRRAVRAQPATNAASRT